MPDEQRAAILAGLRAGLSQGKVARENGCHPSTVCRIAKAEGIDSTNAAPKRALAAKRDYDQVERLQVLNAFFEKAQSMLGRCHAPQEFQQLTVALAVLIDKRRLEDGEATSRQEINTTSAREQALARITDITQRRRAS